MPQASADALAKILPLLRQLRDIKGLREARPGVFLNRTAAFIHIDEEDGALVAHLKKPTGAGFDRYPVDTVVAQRKLVDDAKRRAGRGDDD